MSGQPLRPLNPLPVFDTSVGIRLRQVDNGGWIVTDPTAGRDDRVIAAFSSRRDLLFAIVDAFGPLPPSS